MGVSGFIRLKIIVWGLDMRFINDLKKILVPEKVELDAGGGIVPTSVEQDLKIGVVTCPQCKHEFIKYTDERDLGVEQGGIPYQLLLQIFLSFLVGYALYKCNVYLLPDDAFSNPISVLYSVAIIIPSIVLFISMFAVLYMGLIYIWFYMAVTVSGLGLLVLLGSLFIDFSEAFL
jgi:hypothetical protein